MQLTLAEIANVLQGRWLQPTLPNYEQLQQVVTQISIDSRSLSSRSLFFALSGPHFDGHDFVAAAAAKGAVAAIVAKAAAPPLHFLQLQVAEPLLALQSLAQAWRQQQASPVVAVTGSNGKTTTKELIAAGLTVGGLVHKTTGNLNNSIGVPQTLCAWPQHCWCAVVEMGMSARGEIAFLTKLCQPNIGVITNIAAAHIGGPGLGSLAAIAAAKSELFAHLPAQGVCVVNMDDPWLTQTAALHIGSHQRIDVGSHPQCAVQLLHTQVTSTGVQVQLRVDHHHLQVAVPLLGLHQGHNIALAMAVVWYLGVDLKAAAAKLSQVQIPSGRMQRHVLADQQITILDDCYNANPSSMQAALQTLETLAPRQHLLVVLGDMLELGQDAARYHTQLGAEVAKINPRVLLVIGDYATTVVAAAQKTAAIGEIFTDTDSLAAALQQHLGAHDVVLIKGSRGARLERVVQFLLSLKV